MLHREVVMFENKDTYLEDCRSFCDTRKFVAERWEWQEKPNKSSELVATSALLDEKLETIRGMRLFGRYHLGEDTGFEYIHLGINLSSGFRSRICGLDVHPEFERSHFDLVHKAIHGPHYHVGDCGKVSVHQHCVVKVANDLGIDNLPRWLEIFKEKARVLAHNDNDMTTPPLERDLLGSLL